MPFLLSSGGDYSRFARVQVRAASVIPLEASTCTPYLYTILPHDRNTAPQLHAIAVKPRSFRGLLGYFTLDQTYRVEGIFEEIKEPVSWPSTTYSLHTVDEEGMNIGNKLLDIKESALDDSAPVVTPPLSTPRCSALAEKPYHRDSFARVDSPLKSLPAEVAALGSSSIFSVSFLPQWSRSKWWPSLSRSVSYDNSTSKFHSIPISEVLCLLSSCAHLPCSWCASG